MTSVLLVIPARYGSTRFPGKPLADIAGRSMILRVWDQCRRATLGTEVLVATDDERIASHVREAGGAVVMTDPNLASGSERVAAAAEGRQADIIVNVQGDEPLIDPATIDATIRILLEHADTDIGTAGCALTDSDSFVNPNCVKAVLARDGRALYFSRAPVPWPREGGLPPEAVKHLGIYSFRRDALARFIALPPSPLEETEKLEQLRALDAGMTIRLARVERDSVAVDTPEDLQHVLAVLSAGTA